MALKLTFLLWARPEADDSKGHLTSFWGRKQRSYSSYLGGLLQNSSSQLPTSSSVDFMVPPALGPRGWPSKFVSGGWVPSPQKGLFLEFWALKPKLNPGMGV